MAEFEQKYIYPLIKDKLILFLRYIDIFIVWTKSKKQLNHFMNERNQKGSSLYFEYKFHCKRIEFLDTLLSLSIYIYINKINYRMLFCENQVTFKTFLMRNLNIRTHQRKVFPTVKHFKFGKYVQHPKTNTVTLENLFNNLLIKDTKKMLSLQLIQKVDQLDQKQLLHQQKRHDKPYILLSVIYSQRYQI